MKSSSVPERTRYLVDAYCTDCLAAEELRELEAVLEGDEPARRFFASYCRMHAGLLFAARAEQAVLSARDLTESRPVPAPIIAPLTGAWQGAVSYFSQVGPLSYLLAVAITGAMLLAGSVYQISHYRQFVVKNSRRSTTFGESAFQRPDPVFVGQVTGLKDCRWADPRTAPFNGSYVSLGRKYVLNSGLMEISYKSGAKVILEGPCTYEIASEAGGYLTLGKLTARVDVAKPQTAKTQDPRPKTQDQNPESPNLQTPSSLIPHPSSLFTVRTPTAIITDLGTEFGVEVSAEGNTTSHVFRGKVRVEGSGDRGQGPEAENPKSQIVLAAGESVQVSRVRETHRTPGKKNDLVRFTHPTTPPRFVRRLYEPPKLLDLLDIVAGGNGTGNRRERGIDPVSGRIDHEFTLQYSHGYGRYNPTPWSRLIDGVFVPDGGAEAVQLDSAGHSFDGFPTTSGAIWSVIWSRGTEQKPEYPSRGWIYQISEDQNSPFIRKMMPEGRGLLGIHPNAGITFNLDAVRAMYRGARPASFKAAAAMADARPWDPEADGMADLWIFVDGRLKWKRAGIRPQDGASGVNLEIGPDDRFLTIVSTDGNGDNMRDWVVFGDPALEMAAIENAHDSRKEGQSKKQ